MNAISMQVEHDAREAGYRVLEVEQLRFNRWLLALVDYAGANILVMVQQRLLIGSADVQDLAELIRLRHFDYGMLLSVDGKFSAAAQSTARELRMTPIILCHAFPPASVTPDLAPLLEAV